MWNKEKSRYHKHLPVGCKKNAKKTAVSSSAPKTKYCHNKHSDEELEHVGEEWGVAEEVSYELLKDDMEKECPASSNPDLFSFRTTTLLNCIQRGDDVEEESGDGQWTSLQFNSFNARYHNVELLLDSGKANVNHTTRDGNTALHRACESLSTYYADRKTFLLLISFGANANVARISDGYTPLHIACQYNAGWVVSMLLKKGHALVTCTTHDGETPLSLAHANYSEDVLFVLQPFVSCVIFLCAQNNRCGASSPLQQLPPFILAKICKRILKYDSYFFNPLRYESDSDSDSHDECCF